MPALRRSSEERKLALTDAVLDIIATKGIAALTTRSLGCLREGRELGAIRSDLPAEALAPIVMGTVQMLALASADARHRAPRAEIVRGALARRRHSAVRVYAVLGDRGLYQRQLVHDVAAEADVLAEQEADNLHAGEMPERLGRLFELPRGRRGAPTCSISSRRKRRRPASAGSLLR